MLFRRHEITNTKIKKIIKNSLQAFNLLLHPKNRRNSDGKASAGTSVRGSLTVESAFVLPLFFLCICTLICFMDIYRLQTEKLTRLCQDTKEAGMYAYISGMKNDIQLPSIYTYQVSISVIPLPTLIMTNNVRVHPWTGYHKTGAEEDAFGEMVYVTANGGVYHTNGSCSYLNLSIRQSSGSSVDQLRNQHGAKYHACEICSDRQAPASTVYITDSGSRYHNKSGCSGLKRSVRLVKKAELGNIRLCKRCTAAS